MTERTSETDANSGTGSDGGRGATPPSTDSSSVLWGVVGGLAFLVLIQGYELVSGRGVTLGVKFGVALAVAVGASFGTYYVERAT